MFKWLRATGRSVETVCEAFEEYEGRASYVQMGLEPPKPMEQDEGHSDEWSHMSDYDEMGAATGHENHHSDMSSANQKDLGLDNPREEEPQQHPKALEHLHTARSVLTDTQQRLEAHNNTATTKTRESVWNNPTTISTKHADASGEVSDQTGALVNS